MKETLTRQEVCQMLPTYVLGALEEHQMLACQSYLRKIADQTLLRKYRDAEEMAATPLMWTLPQLALPAWVKEQLMARVQKDLAHRHLYRQSPMRPHTKRFFSQHKDWRREIIYELETNFRFGRDLAKFIN